MIKWMHIPAQPDKMLPEQWQARVGDRSVAVLRRGDGNIWNSVLVDTDGDVSALEIAAYGVGVHGVQFEVEENLMEKGWK